jgi:hypothetical protein
MKKSWSLPDLDSSRWVQDQDILKGLLSLSIKLDNKYYPEDERILKYNLSAH